MNAVKLLYKVPNEPNEPSWLDSLLDEYKAQKVMDINDERLGNVSVYQYHYNKLMVYVHNTSKLYRVTYDSIERILETIY